MSLGVIAGRIARIRAPLSAKLRGAFLVMLVALLATGAVSLSAIARIRAQVADLTQLDEVLSLARALDYSIVAITLVAVGLFVGSVGLAMGLSVVLARSIVHPIQDVEAALEQIARGEFGAVTSVVNRDEVGSLVAYVNRTSAQLAELRRTQMQLIQSEKLRALREMSGGIAHDFNNLLAGVLGQAEILLHQLETDTQTPGDAERRLRLIQQAALDGAETIRRLVEFTRATPEGESQQSVNVREAVDAVLAVAEPRWRDEARARGRAIEVVTDIADIPPMLGCPAGLHEVILSLVFNAIDAMPDGGRLTVSAHSDGRTMTIAVADTGVGMSPEIVARIFEPFFTTKGSQRSGLGLSASYGVVQRHGGTLSVTSAPGQGAVFTVVLPFRPSPSR